MLASDAGDIRFEGTPVIRMPAHLRAGLGIARTFQNIKLFPRMSVLENVMVGYHSRGRSGFLPGMLALPFARREEKEIRARALEKLSLFGLAGASDMPAASLPFGSQRGVEMARALIMEPTLLMLDEPAAGLNIHETRALAGRIADINASGVTVLIVEHDMSLVMDISHEIAVLNYGGLIAQGPPREIQRNEEVVRIYLGEDHA
jgi:ABC-type branched-subunit amino acid transport system ATPase component